jgi:hypothetical protein
MNFIISSTVLTPAMRIHAEAECSERIERGCLARGIVLAVDEQEIGEEDQPAVGDDRRLERAQRSCSGVARIDEGRRSPSRSRSSFTR